MSAVFPELAENLKTGLQTPSGDASVLARGVEGLVADPTRRIAMGQAGKRSAAERFTAEVIVPRYEALHRRACERSR